MSFMIEGQDAERKRIAQDLHEELGGLLSTVKAQLNIIQLHVSQLESFGIYQKASGLIDDASSELRRITCDMTPGALTRLGLAAAMKDLSDTLQNTHDLDVDLQILTDNSRLDETTEIMLYRIVQELCANIIRHAGASWVLIQLNKTEYDLFLIIEDNGKGFDPAARDGQQGTGLRSIASRVHYLNGTLDIRSSPGQGTCATIQVPINNNTS